MEWKNNVILYQIHIIVTGASIRKKKPNGTKGRFFFNFSYSFLLFSFSPKAILFPDDCLLLQFAPDLAQLRINGLNRNQAPKTA